MSFSGMLNLMLLSVLVILLDYRAKLHSVTSVETVSAFQCQQGNTGCFHYTSSGIHGLDSMIRIHILKLSGIKADLAKLLAISRLGISRLGISIGVHFLKISRVLSLN
jgi:hypothetical protein